MNFELERAWQEMIQSFKLDYDETPQVDAVLFVIGLQELNMPFERLTKDQKLDVIHIGLCAVFTPLGYYEPIGRDQDGWIHFKSIKKFPKLTSKEQEEVIKEAVIDYYK